MITAAASLVVSIILLILQTINNARTKRAEERNGRETQERLLSLKMMSANNKLSYACAMAIKRGRPNGEVEEAVEAYEEAKQEYDAFLMQVAAEQLKR